MKAAQKELTNGDVAEAKARLKDQKAKAKSTASAKDKKFVMKLTNTERLMVLAHRGTDLTGYPMHECEDGKERFFYYWSWGGQPNLPLLHKNPLKAARLFLELYNKCPIGEKVHGCTQPTRRKVAPVKKTAKAK